MCLVLDYISLAHVFPSARLVASADCLLSICECADGFSSLTVLKGHRESGSEVGLAGSLGYHAYSRI